MAKLSLSLHPPISVFEFESKTELNIIPRVTCSHPDLRDERVVLVPRIRTNDCTDGGSINLILHGMPFLVLFVYILSSTNPLQVLLSTLRHSSMGKNRNGMACTGVSPKVSCADTDGRPRTTRRQRTTTRHEE